MDKEVEISATERSMQDIASDIEGKLFGGSEPEAKEEEVASEDVEKLPEDDDTDSNDDEGSDDEEVVDEVEQDQTLADYLGIPEDRVLVNDDGSVSVNAIIDGETKAVPLKDLVSSYQLQGHVNNNSIALSNERKEFEEQKAEITKSMQTRMEGMQNLSKILEQQVVADYNAIDWDKLRTQNPAEWTALRQEYAEKAQKLQQAQSLIAEEGKRLSEEQQQKQQQELQAHLKSEFDKMLVDNPDWTDDSKREADISAMRDFLTSTYGFNDEDMATVSDHRLIKLIKDAKSYREGKKSAEVKKVKTVPKFQKPGSAKANAASLAKARAVKAKRAAVKKTGSVKDVANLIVDRM